MINKKAIRFNDYARYILTDESFFINNTFDDLLREHALKMQESKDDDEEEKAFTLSTGNDFWQLGSDADLEYLNDDDGNLTYETVSEKFDLFQKHARVAQEKLADKIPQEKIYYVNLMDPIEIKVKLTLDALNNPNIRLIFNPYFSFQKEDNTFLASSFAFDKFRSTLYNIKYSGSTNVKDYLKAFYDLDVFDHAMSVNGLNRYQSKNYGILVFDYPFNTRKGDIFYALNYHAAAIKSAISKKKYLSREENLLFKRGIYLDYKSFRQKRKNQSIFTFYKTHSLYSEKDQEEVEKLEKKLALISLPSEIKADVFQETDKLPFITTYLDPYWDGLEEDRFDSKFFDYYRDRFSTPLGDHPYKKEMINFFFPALQNANKKVYSVKNIEKFGYENYLERFEKSKNISEIYDDNHFLEVMSDYLLKDVIYVWYDFETISLPESILKSYYPYDKVPFQVSLIWTKNGVETDRVNHVLDTTKITLKDLKDVIDLIYARQGKEEKYHYVSYNKSFENSVIAKIQEALQDAKAPDVLNYATKISYITRNTIDLEDFFKQRSMSKIPPYLIGELNGLSSIKRLEKYLTKKDYPLKTQIKVYANLPVSNGLLAMSAGIKRYLHITTDHSWHQTVVPNLKDYCENDVVMMIRVFEFMTYQAKQKYPNFSNFTYRLRQDEILNVVLTEEDYFKIKNLKKGQRFTIDDNKHLLATKKRPSK